MTLVAARRRHDQSRVKQAASFARRQLHLPADVLRRRYGTRLTAPDTQLLRRWTNDYGWIGPSRRTKLVSFIIPTRLAVQGEQSVWRACLCPTNTC